MGDPYIIEQIIVWKVIIEFPFKTHDWHHIYFDLGGIGYNELLQDIVAASTIPWIIIHITRGYIPENIWNVSTENDIFSVSKVNLIKTVVIKCDLKLLLLGNLC